MHNLSPEKYSLVHLKFESIKPWILMESCLPRLKENAFFVKEMVQTQSLKLTDKNIFFISQLYDLKKDNDLEEDYLFYLGLRSIGAQGDSFLDWKKSDSWKKTADLSLMTERFLYPFNSNIGAGRHVLLKNIHLKGIGRNSLSIQEEFSHSWGGMMIKDALKSILIDQYAQKRSSLGTLKIFGAFIYDQLQTNGVPYCVLVRDSKSYRLAQLNPMFLSLEEKEKIKVFLYDHFKSTDPSVMLFKIVDHYIHSYRSGIKYKSISPDNLLIDGRWIDTESIDLNLDGSAHDEWISLKTTDHLQDDQFEREMPFKNFYDKQNNLLFCDSWIHQLFLMCQQTSKVYENLWPNHKFNFDFVFEERMKFYFTDSDLPYWFSLLHSYESELSELFGSPRLKINKFEYHTSNLDQYKLRGYFENTLLNFKKFTFGQKSTDPFEQMIPVINKWEKIFWPIELTEEAALELGKQIQKLGD